MREPACACGATGKIVFPSGDPPASNGQGVLEWRGGRIGSGLLALEQPREGVAACPACQHRPSVFMLARDAGRQARRA